MPGFCFLPCKSKNRPASNFERNSWIDSASNNMGILRSRTSNFLYINRSLNQRRIIRRVFRSWNADFLHTNPLLNKLRIIKGSLKSWTSDVIQTLYSINFDFLGEFSNPGSLPCFRINPWLNIRRIIREVLRSSTPDYLCISLLLSF